MITTLTLLTLLTGSAPTSQASPDDAFRVRVLTHSDAAFATTIVVETRRHLVIIDPGFSPAHAARIDSIRTVLGKSVHAVLLTHAHVDHYGALAWLDRGGARVMSSAGVARQLATWDETNYARFGMTSPGAPRPDMVLGSGQAIEVDGVTFTLIETGPGESYEDAVFLVRSGRQQAAVVGDLVMFGIPPFAQSGHTREWIRTLERLDAMLPDDTPVYIGHDLAAAPESGAGRNRSILRWQIARLRAFRAAVAGLTHRARLLTEPEIASVVSMLRTDAPENLEAFDFLVTTSANLVAAELIAEREKEGFELRLQALFASSQEGTD